MFAELGKALCVKSVNVQDTLQVPPFRKNCMFSDCRKPVTSFYCFINLRGRTELGLHGMFD